MRQYNYDTIVKCIQHGAPALAGELIADLNQDVENANKWLQEQKRIAEQARKAEIDKAKNEDNPKPGKAEKSKE